MVEHSKEDLAWLAGFVDGEGCITVLKMVINGHVEWNPSFQLRLEISTTHYDTMKFIHARFGGWLSKKKKKEGRKQVWKWFVSGTVAVSILESIYPYLKTKRLQAETAFEYKKYFGKGFIPQKFNIYERLKNINRKGDAYESFVN